MSRLLLEGIKKNKQNKVVKEIRKYKQDYFDKFDRQLLSDNHDPKLIWKTFKQVLNLDKSSSGYQLLNMNNEFAEAYQTKAEMLNLYYSSQTRVDDTNKDLTLLEPALHLLNTILSKMLRTFFFTLIYPKPQDLD